MKVISVITEPAVIGRILKHIVGTGGHDPFEGRGPPEGELAGEEALEGVASGQGGALDGSLRRARWGIEAGGLAPVSWR
ncbi:MAG: hypothetical protein KAY32_13020, partial [Candidatus Eisenbacteria sp.]|nr:hypothetical protein [Candidatus Eisenbacteria bacterium]